MFSMFGVPISSKFSPAALNCQFLSLLQWFMDFLATFDQNLIGIRNTIFVTLDTHGILFSKELKE